jgi:hypothetical protein
MIERLSMDETFRPACLAAALRTVDLNPLDVLLSEDRIPRTVDAEEGRTARPTWVGRNYQPGGVLLLGKNPGGGSPSFERMRPQWDFAFFDAIKRLRDERDMEAYLHLSDHAQPNAMRQWPMWRSISAVLDALGLDLFSVAMGNLVPFRTNGNKVLAQEFEAAWRLDVLPIIQLLQPRLIVKMTNEFSAFARYCPHGIMVQQFHRANGDNHITPAGNADLVQLRKLNLPFNIGDETSSTKTISDAPNG